MKHLDANNILTKIQGGYRKSCSTLDTISKLTNDILRERNQGRATMAAFIDTMKAFDCVNYSILFKKLEKYGIKNTNLKCLRNYLADRQQITIANGITSPPLPLTCGVPQESILGPLLFLIYVNDVVQEMENVKILLYADDTVLYSHGTCPGNIKPFLERGLNSYAHWSSKNKLSMNEKKTKLVYFTSSIRYKSLHLNDIDINVNGKKLHFVPSYKYLGVILDYELTYNAYVKDLKKSLGFRSYLLGNLKLFVPTDIMLRIYKTYALPVIDYSDILYNGANADLLLDLQRIQNRCLKHCLKLPMLSSTDYVHQQAGLPMLNERRSYHAKIQGFKSAKKTENCATNAYRTRAFTAPVLKYNVIHTAAYQRSLEVYVSQTWNALNPDMRNTESISQFKKLAKKILADTIPKNRQNIFA